MKRKELSEAISGISIRHVQEAEDYTAKTAYKRSNRSNRSNTSNTSRYRNIFAAALAACIFGCAALACIPSTARSLKGYFQNVIQWNGAVTGQTYQEGADEIAIRVTDAVRDNKKFVLSVQMQVSDTQEPPFGQRFISEIALGTYRITDASGIEICVASGRQEHTAGLLEEQTAQIELVLEADAFAPGDYVLEVASVYGLQKAEQPLEIKGNWKCMFTM